MAGVPMTNHGLCDVSGTTKCTSILHRQIRELKSRWRMRWAALEETIEVERKTREEFREILDHIVCKAKSARKSRERREHRDPNWMEIRISTMLIRAFLRTIWPDRDELRCEALALDAYYGQKLKYPSLDSGDVDLERVANTASVGYRLVGIRYQDQATRDDCTSSDECSKFDLDSQSADHHGHSSPSANTDAAAAPAIPGIDMLSQSSSASGLSRDTSSTAQGSLTSEHQETPAEAVSVHFLNDQHDEDKVLSNSTRTEDDRVKVRCEESRNISDAVTDSVTVQVDDSFSLSALVASQWYEIPPQVRHNIHGRYPWTSHTPSDAPVPPRRLKASVDQFKAGAPAYTTTIPNCDSAVPTFAVGTVIVEDYKIQTVVRAEKNFVVYSAQALFSGQGIFVLTAIRNPQDFKQAYRMLREARPRHSPTHMAQKDEGNEFATKCLACLKKAADSQKKYVTKLIKKRQAPDACLDTFRYDGLIWTVQSQTPYKSPEGSKHKRKFKEPVACPRTVLAKAKEPQGNTMPEQLLATLNSDEVDESRARLIYLIDKKKILDECASLVLYLLHRNRQIKAEAEELSNDEQESHAGSPGTTRPSEGAGSSTSEHQTSTVEQNSSTQCKSADSMSVKQSGRTKKLRSRRRKSQRDDRRQSAIAIDGQTDDSSANQQYKPLTDAELGPGMSGRQTLRLAEAGVATGVWHKRAIDVFIKGDIRQGIPSPIDPAT